MERDLREQVAAAGEGDPWQALATARRERSTPIITRIQQWVMTQRVLPQSGLGKAIGYLVEKQ